MAQHFSASLDRRGGVRERALMRLHLLVCVYCVRYLRQLRFVREVLRAPGTTQEPDAASGEGLARDARERIEEALRGRAGS